MQTATLLRTATLVAAALSAGLAAAQPNLTWQQLPISGPTPRANAAAAYDAPRDRVVLHGGSTASGRVGDTWEFDGEHWLKREDVNQFGSMEGHAMAYDQSRRQTVLTTTYIGRFTKLYDGVAWTQALVPQLPPRADFAMAYDPSRQWVYQHGGWGQLDCCEAYSDLWRWDGQSWLRLQRETMPGRMGHKMVFDTKRGRLVVHGGDNAFSKYYSDTWEWDGVAWEEIVGAGGPERTAHGMIYHEGLGLTLLFGGSDSMSTLFRDDLWAWDGVTWTRLDVTGPSARRGHAMVYDSLRQRAVVCGGAVLADTWLLVEASPPPACPANCTGDTDPVTGKPILDIQDFSCFQNAFALGDLAKADVGGGPPGPGGSCAPDGLLSITDFTCFQNLFALGCK